MYNDLMSQIGEFQEIKSHNASITRLRMTWDEQLLVTASDDGCIFIYDVKDKDAKAAARRDQEKMDWALEVLVTRSELDERRSRMSELEQQVRSMTCLLSKWRYFRFAVYCWRLHHT